MTEPKRDYDRESRGYDGMDNIPFAELPPLPSLDPQSWELDGAAGVESVPHESALPEPADRMNREDTPMLRRNGDMPRRLRIILHKYTGELVPYYMLFEKWGGVEIQPRYVDGVLTGIIMRVSMLYYAIATTCEGVQNGEMAPEVATVEIRKLVETAVKELRPRVYFVESILPAANYGPFAEMQQRLATTARMLAELTQLYTDWYGREIST